MEGEDQVHNCSCKLVQLALLLCKSLQESLGREIPTDVGAVICHVGLGKKDTRARGSQNNKLFNLAQSSANSNKESSQN